MLRLFSIAAVLCVFILPADARSVECIPYNNWKILNETRVAELGLTEHVAALSKGVSEAPKGGGAHLIIQVIPTDCPVWGYEIRAIKLPVLQLGGGSGPVSKYGLYVAADYLRNRDNDTLTRIARQQVCIIQSGAADQPERERDPDTPNIRRCMMQSAILFGDTEYAKWLSKGLDILATQQETPLNPRQQEIQRAIDKVKSLPNAPPGMLEDLEKLKKTFD